MPHSSSPGPARIRVRAAALVAVAITCLAAPLQAQTDYYNTSAGRPLRIEDATPLEYRGVELNLAPIRWESARNGTNRWSLHPEVAVGVFPRTQIQIAAPFAHVDETSSSTTGLAGLEISALHALNAETSIPALALGADLALPIGPLAADAAYGTFKVVMTRTLSAARIHANAQVTAGPTVRDVDEHAGASDVSRWLAGIAVDKTLPLRSLLLSVESFAEQPIREGASLEWNVGAGIRMQLAPRWAFDGGVGRRLTGDDQLWYVTLGSAYALGIPW
jgi:hypothetical protein